MEQTQGEERLRTEILQGEERPPKRRGGRYKTSKFTRRDPYLRQAGPPNKTAGRRELQKRNAKCKK